MVTDIELNLTELGLEIQALLSRKQFINRHMSVLDFSITMTDIITS